MRLFMPFIGHPGLHKRFSLRLYALAATFALAVATACSSSTPPTSVATPLPTDAPVSTATSSPGLGSPTATIPTPVISAPGDFIPGVIPVPPDRDLYDLARRLTLQSAEPVDRFASPPPPRLNRGDTLEWKVSRDSGIVIVNAEVRHISEHAYWIFEDGFSPDQGRIEQAAEDFESNIWPNVINTLGDVWNPGVDGDPRIAIFHGQLRAGVAGYFSGADEYPVQIQPDSNQREAVHISANALALGGTGYLSTLAHELQHAIHWAADAGEESWVNEGIAELASALAGFQPGSISAFLSRPNTSLVQWEPEIFQASPNYGASALFFDYIAAHYGGFATLRAIINDPSDGIISVNNVLSEMGFNETATDIFTDWVVANFADDDAGPYSHPHRDINRPRTTFIPVPDSDDSELIEDSVRPFGTNYYTLENVNSSVEIRFDGQPTGQVFPAEPRSGETCWWSNTGDSINSTLTRPVDLTGVDSATFEFWTWYAIEEDWDYAYVTVSTDDGVTWQVLPSQRSSFSNPNGTAFGPGLTGLTNGWVQDEVSLNAYAGREILLRLEYITDDAIHDRGACFDDFSIPEIGWSDSTDGLNGWTSNGFALINDRIEVEYLVQVVRDTEGGQAQVERMTVAADGSGDIVIEEPGEGEQLTIAVSLLTADVTGSLDYTLEIALPRL